MVKSVFEYLNDKFNFLNNPNALEDSILVFLEHNRKKELIRNYIFFVIGVLFSFSVFLYFTKLLLINSLESGLFDYIKILFLDFESMPLLWLELLNSILYSAPIFEIIFITGSCFVLLILTIWFAKKYKPSLLVR